MKLRSKKVVDYKKLSGEMADSDQEMEFEASGEISEVESVTSEAGYPEEEAEYINMSESEFDEEVQKAMKKEDEVRLEWLFQIKEKRCEKLKQQVEKSEKEDKARRRRIKAWEDKFKRLNKTEASLSKSLASSRNNTPSSSPKRSAKKVSAKKPTAESTDTAGARKKVPRKTSPPKKSTKLDFSTSKEARGE